MPVVIPLIGTAIAWGGALGALGTIGTLGVGALTVAETMSLVAAVGATIGTVGVIARDKNLQTAGLVIGGIGAIGGLAAGAGLIDGNASMFGQSEAELATQIPASVDITPSVWGSTSGTDIGMGAASQDVIDSLAVTPVEQAPLGPLSGNVPDPNRVMETQIAANMSGNTAQDIGGSGSLGVPAAGQMSPSTFAPKTPSGEVIKGATQFEPPAEPTTASAATGPTMTRLNIVAPAGPATGPPAVAGGPATGGLAKVPIGGIQGALGGLWDFAKENQMVSYGLIQAGSSLVQGLFDPLKPAQINELNSQGDLNRANAALTAQQLSNMQGGLPVASLKPRPPAPVTGQPAGQPNPMQQPPYSPQGLINISPSSQLVTGVPRL